MERLNGFDPHVEDVEIGEDTGLVRVLKDKERQVEVMKEKIQRIENQNNLFDKTGKVKRDQVYDFNFDMGGKI